MAGNALALHALDDVREPVAGRVEVRVVDLPDVAAEHDLGAVADPGDDRLHLVGREVLRLVDDHELVRDAASADVGDRLEHELARRHELVDALLRRSRVRLAGAVAAARAEQVRDVVEDRLHPHRELLVLVARQVADVTAQRHDRPRDEQLVEALLLEDLVHARGKRHQRLAGACRADQRDDLDLVVEKQVERHRLLHVAREHAVDGLARSGDGNHMACVGEPAGQSRVRGVGLVLEHRILVGDKLRARDALPVRAARVVRLEPLHRELALRVEVVDDVCRDLHVHEPRVQPVRIDAVCLEVLRGHAERVALHARVDVLGHEDGAHAARVQRCGHRDDPVVDDAWIEPGRHGDFRARDPHRSALRIPGDALEQVAALAKPVERADHGARIAPRLVVGLLEGVELLDHADRDHHLVLLELEDRVRVVQQHVGVKHKALAHLLVPPLGLAGIRLLVVPAAVLLSRHAYPKHKFRIRACRTVPGWIFRDCGRPRRGLFTPRWLAVKVT